MKNDVISYLLGGGAFVCGWLAWEIFEGPGFFGVDLVWAIPLAIITLILGGLFILRARKFSSQRTKKFKDLAEHMGMEFSAKGDSALLESLSAFDLFSQSGVKITNVLHGDSEQLGYGEEFEVRILEHIYSSGESTISQTVICFRSPQLSLPDFSMRPEHFFHKIGSVLGYQDIDFESHPTAVEFSKKYLLRGKDEQTIRALFTDKVLTFFAAHPDVGNGHLPFWHWSQYEVCVEGSGDQLILYRAGIGIKPEDIPAFMKEGFEVFRLFTQEQN